jgi:hypothetical protein
MAASSQSDRRHQEGADAPGHIALVEKVLEVALMREPQKDGIRPGRRGLGSRPQQTSTSGDLRPTHIQLSELS